MEGTSREPNRIPVRDTAEVLLGVSTALVSSVEREPLFEAVARAIRSAIQFERATLTAYEPEADVFRILCVEGIMPAGSQLVAGATFPRQGSRSGEAFEHRKGLVVDDLQKVLRLCWEDRCFLADKLRTRLIVPLVTPRRTIGVMSLASQTPGAFSPLNVELVAAIGPQVAVAVESMLACEEIASLKARLGAENIFLKEQILARTGIVGETRPVRRMLEQIEAVAPTMESVLISGEPGTGKSLVAHAIHKLSRKRTKSVLAVHCSAVPAGLFETAFEGYGGRKASDQFNLADCGTLLLEDVMELPQATQRRLVRALQEMAPRAKAARSRIRLIATTTPDLKGVVAKEAFLPELYRRLNVFPIRVPPLRERKEDIPLLVAHFVREHGREFDKRINLIREETLDALREHNWPGNVRELETVTLRGVMRSDGPFLKLGRWRPGMGVPWAWSPARLVDVDRLHILETLDHTAWRVSGSGGAAELLGLKPTTLEARMKRLGIERSQRGQRGGDERRPPT